MATTTARLKLRKPDTTDVVNVAADMDANLDALDAAISAQVCTSGTRPGTPYVGQFIFETDTQRLLFWSGTAWGAIGRFQIGVEYIDGRGAGTGGAVLELISGALGSGDEMGAVEYFEAGAEKWRIYKLAGDGNLYIRDITNGVMKLIIPQGVGGAGVATFDGGISINNGTAATLATFNTDGSVSGGANSFAGVMQNYTPVLSNGTWAVGNGTLTGKYKVQGKLLFVIINYTFGSTSVNNFAVVPQFSLPPGLTSIGFGDALKCIIGKSGVNNAMGSANLGSTLQINAGIWVPGNLQGGLLSATVSGFTAWGSANDSLQIAGTIPLA